VTPVRRPGQATSAKKSARRPVRPARAARPVRFGPRGPVRRPSSAPVRVPFPSFVAPAYTFEIQESRGTLSILGPRRFPLLEKFWIEVELADGDVHTSVQSGFTAGPGHWVAELANGRIALELSLKRAANPSGILLAVTVRNRGTDPLEVRQVRIARVALGRELSAWGPVEEWKVLRMGYAFGGAHREDADIRNSTLVSLTGDLVQTRSWGVMAVRFGGTTKGLVAGFVTAGRQLGWIELRKDRGEVEWSAGCELDGSPVAPGGAVETETLYLGLAEDVRRGLVDWAQLQARQMRVKLKPVPHGWCTWYGYGKEGVSEQVVLDHARFIADRRGRLPLDIIQVDDGYETAYGDWLTSNDRFPGGLAKLAGGIREHGLIPGIWVAPFVAQASSALFKAHPEWMVMDDTGKPLAWEVEWAEPKEPWYAVDGSHPEARRWLRDTFAALRAFGFGYFKLDFLFLGMVPGHRSAPGTRVAAYRAGLEAIREGAGDAYLLGCTAPYPPSVGLMDGMRVSHDIHPGGDLWTTFAEAMRETHQRSYAHRALWNTDHDVLLLRDIGQSGSDTARAIATSIGMSGGALFAGDPLLDLPEDRLELLAQVLAGRHDAPAVPMDLFDRDAPRILALPAGRGKYRVGVFNDTTVSRSAAIDLEMFGLARARVSVIQGDQPRVLGTYRKRVLTPPVPAHGVTLLLLES